MLTNFIKNMTSFHFCNVYLNEWLQRSFSSIFVIDKRKKLENSTVISRIIFISLLFLNIQSKAQDTVSVLYYNLLNFPQINQSRISHLETIVHHLQPDVLVVNELTSLFGSNYILSGALNTNGITHYEGATYVYGGHDSDNMLYYDSSILGLVGQEEITTSLRDINQYVLYYKEPGINPNTDTIYINIYSSHLKAGNDFTDEQKRADETLTFSNHLNSLPENENIVFGGDMNIYGSYEQAYLNLTASSFCNFYDPLGSGNYHNNASFSSVFTQSTRSSNQFDGGAIGGMDDRFDMVFFSKDLITGINGVRYSPGSYRAIGQDGNRWNGSLISPANTIEPSVVIDALYYMSDHLPVYVDLILNGPVGIKETNGKLQKYFIHENTLQMEFNKPFSGKLMILDVMGRVIEEQTVSFKTSHSIDLSSILTSGIYMAYLDGKEFKTTLQFYFHEK